MKVYTKDNDGYIIGIKNVGKKYIMNPDDVKGKAPFESNHHYETGLERPKSQEQLDSDEIEQLKSDIDNKRYVDLPVTVEQARLKELLGL